MIDPSPVLVRGLGDVGSAVAWRLFRAGRPVVLHDGPRPAVLRRGMALADAAFDGTAVLDGVTAQLVEDPGTLRDLLATHAAVPVVTWPFERLRATLAPFVLVDARMRKRTVPEVQRDLAPLTIGLGPNFTAGETTDLVVETSWGAHLGAIIHHGPALPLRGEPRPIAGIGRERCVYAPCAGRFRTLQGTDHDIGAIVERGEPLARIGDKQLLAPLAGRIRGLVRDGASVAEGVKVIEIDPRGTAAMVHGRGERPRRIAEGVLQAIESASSTGSRSSGKSPGPQTPPSPSC